MSVQRDSRDVADSDTSRETLVPILAVAVLSFLAYAGTHWLFRATSRSELFNYHAYLADAFLKGSLALVSQPPTTLDLSEFGGKLFLYWGPVPALMLMPIVWIFGIHWSDVWLTIALATLSTTLAFVLLRQTRRLHGLSDAGIVILTFTYGFGSPQYPLAVDGTVWFVSQLFTSVFLTSALICVFRERQNPSFLALAGLFVGMACLTRASVIASVLWLFTYAGYVAWRSNVKASGIQARLLSAFVPLAVLLAAVSWYNYARFGSALETGVSYHLADPSFAENIRRYGIFSFHYLEKNFFYHYVAYPYPISPQTVVGGSLFLLTPVYLAAFLSFSGSLNRFLLWLTWGTCFLLALPSLLVCGTGEVQLGPRYTLDYAPFFLLLVASGLRSVPVQVAALLAGVSFLQYFYGLFALS